MSKLRLNVVGCGAVGQTLAAAWHKSGHFTIQDLVSRSRDSVQRAREFIGAGAATESLAAMRGADVWMLTVPDDEIANVVAALAANGIAASSQLIFHCSGSLSSQLLKGLQSASGDATGPAVGSMHPLLGFSNPASAMAELSGSFAAVEGDALAMDLLESAARSVELSPVRIDAARKTFYHAGCVFASNYLVTLLKIAGDLLTYSGVDERDALRMLAPLAEKNVRSVFSLGPAAALTGPIVRGDVEVVERHIEALRLMFPECVDLYLNLAAHTLELAAEKSGEVKGG